MPASRGPVTQTSVIVVGGGPVGLALALDLGMREISVTLVEHMVSEPAQPRMDLVGVRTMEFCRRWGIVGEVEAAGFERDAPQHIVYVSSVFGEEYCRDLRPTMRGEQPPPFSPQKRERCPQNFFDPVLRRAAERQSSVDMMFGVRAGEVRQTARQVEVDILDRNGNSSVLVGQYLVACDGASSGIRQSLGIGLVGPPALTYSLNILFRCPGIRERLGETRGYRYILIDDTGIWGSLVNIDGRDTWRLQIIGGHERRTWLDDEIDRALKRALGDRLSWEIVSAAPWTRREAVALSFGSGRVFLAGDSAHQMSPTGGYGMNTGITDATNLSWKLEAALAGWAGPKLLDSYELERRPVANWAASVASANLGRMLAIRPDPDHHNTGRPGQLARRRLGLDVQAAMQEEWRSIGVHIGYRYTDSPICWPVHEAAPPVATASYEQTAHVGGRAPHVWLSPGFSTLDLFGEGFVLLDFAGPEADCAGMLAASNARRTPMRRVAIASPEARAVYERRFVLVRPDGHVAWRGDEIGAEPMALVDRIRGAT